jgi:hypothetical protein
MLVGILGRLRGPLLGAAAFGLVIAVPTAVAGSGVGDVFNIGVANTVNAETSLSGTVGGNPQLRVENAATTQNAFGVLGRITAGAAGSQSAGLRGINSATNGNGFGVWGFHQSAGVGVFGETGTGTGVLGRHTASGGLTPGVQGETASTAPGAAGVFGTVKAATPGTDSAGVRGTTATPFGYGVFGENTGSGAGVFGESAGRAGILGKGDSTGGSLFSPNTGVYACGAPAGAPGCPAVPSFGGMGTGGFFLGNGALGIGAYGCGGGSCAFTFGVPFGGQFHASGSGAVGVGGRAAGSGAVGGKFDGEGVGVLARSSGGLAGRFEGDVDLTGKLTREYTSGTPNQATPIAYGVVTSGGSRIAAASTPNFTSSFDSVNKRYEITITGETYSINGYTTVATPTTISAPRFIATQSAGGKLLIKIFDLTGAAVQTGFSFTTFKP